MAFDMAQSFGGGSSFAGDLSGWAGGVSAPVAKVTDMSAHVDGGPDSARGSNVMTTDGARMNLYCASAIVAVAVLLLWASGALVFRSHNL
jgi:hypothetical protein